MIIFRAAIKRICKNKIKLAILVVMPLIFILMFATQKGASLSMAVVDQDNSTLSKKLTESVEQMYRVKVQMLSEAEIYDKTVTHQLDYSIIIRKDFEEKLLSGDNPILEEFYIEEKEKLFFARIFIDNYIGSMKLLAKGAGFDKTKFESALKEFDKNKLALSNESNSGDEAHQSRLAMGFLVQFMLYMSVVTAGIILEDKNSEVFYRVFYAPVSLKAYLFENLGAFLIVGILQVVVIIALVKNVLGLVLGENGINMYFLFSVFSLVCISLGLLVVSLFKKPLHAYGLIFFLTTPLVMLGGSYWSKNMMPDIMVKISRFIPTSWVMDAVDKLLFKGGGLKDILLEIFILLIFAGIFLAAGLFKKVDVSK